MYSNYIPFQSVVQSVKDEIGVETLENDLPKIRRMITDIEKDMGYGGASILKRMTYSVEKGSIKFQNGVYKLKLPEDIIRLEAVGMCKEGICPGDYIIQGNYMFFCKGKKITKFSLIYYALLYDGYGNPVITDNHKNAIVAGISWKLYKPEVRKRKGNGGFLQMLEREYVRALAEAVGDDVMPNTQEEWSAAANILKRNSIETMMYNIEKRCFCKIEETVNPEDRIVMQEETPIYSFQFDNRIEGINQLGELSLEWLEANATLESEEKLLNGTLVSYETIGFVGFAIFTDTPGEYIITDILNNKLNEDVFITVFDETRGIEYFVSREYYTPSSVFYKFEKQ